MHAATRLVFRCTQRANPRSTGARASKVSFHTLHHHPQAAFEYAKKIQPTNAKLPMVHDALQLGACGSTRPEAPVVAVEIAAGAPVPSTGHVLYVSPTGKDTAAGTESAPLGTSKRVNESRQY